MYYGLKRGAAGLFYLAIYQLGLFIVPDNYLLSPEFTNKSLIVKMLLLGVWGRCTLYKYISCWIISEGAATCFGE
jgi:lysophospholipid acyltransferase 5